MIHPKMEKQYFPHDYNARGDENIIALMAEHGMAGYGIYWTLVEKLFEAEGYLELNYKLISFDLRIDVKIVKDIVENFKLFKVKGPKFYSESVLRRLAIRRAKTGKASMAAHSRWNKEAQDDNGFKAFWKAYPKQEGPDAALAAWNEKKPPLDKCLKALAWQSKLPKWLEGSGEFIPSPAKYILAGRWKDVQHGHEEFTCHKCGHTGALKKGHQGAIKCGNCGNIGGAVE